MGTLIRPLSDGPIDVIGDVHGEIDALLALLHQLGYDAHGAHPAGRRAVFIGDLTDRGPDSVAVASLVMDWVARGHAHCVLGNHELNLLRNDPKAGNAWMLDPTRAEQQADGEFSHSRVASPEFRGRFIDFLGTLPVAFERADLRLVHAAWLDEPLQVLRESTGSVLAVFNHHEARIESSLAASGLAAAAEAQRKQWHGVLHHRHAKDVPLLEDMGRCEALRQMGNPVRVATSGAERPAKQPFWSAGKWRMVDRVPWWNEYTGDVPVIVGHYWRRWQPISGSDHAANKPDLFDGARPGAWLGPRGKVFCVDYCIGARYYERKSGHQPYTTHLMAMRWPERELWGERGRVLE